MAGLSRKSILISIAVVVGAAVFVGILIERRGTDTPPRTRLEIYNYDRGTCPGELISFKVDDPYMRGILSQGAEVDVTLNAYSCSTPEKGAIALYRFSEFDPPVLRRIVAIAGDRFSLKFVNETKGWELLVNGKPVTGVSGERYTFGGSLPPPLKLAEGARHGILRENEVILLSSFPPGDRDSGVFGVISTGDLVGRAKQKGSAL